MARTVGLAAESTPEKPEDDGRIPFTFRIGVTGHRQLGDSPATTAAVRDALTRLTKLFPRSGATDVAPIVVSALAEGADRLVVHEILAGGGARLEAVLPLPAESYLDDFAEEASKNEFRTLLERASYIWQAPPSASREEAYERAGRYVVDRCDVIIAVWDGEPARGRGGTAGVVAYARQSGAPLVWVRIAPPSSVTEEFGSERAGVLRDAARSLNEYNSCVVQAAAFRRQMDAESEQLKVNASTDREESFNGSLRDRAFDWVIPYFVRADLLTLRIQRRFMALSTAMFAMAAAAVAVIAIQSNFLSDLNLIVAIEVILLLFLLSVPRLNRRWRLHDRWISYRFLAERLRSSYFLALAGTGDRGSRSRRVVYFADPWEAWIERALAEVMARRPAVEAGPDDVVALRRYLSNHWIGGQQEYHEKAAHRYHDRDEKLMRATGILFGSTLVAAILHTLGIGRHGSHETHWSALLTVLSITIPAVGAALHGIGTQRQFRRHSQRSTRMAMLLRQLRNDMDTAQTLSQVRQVAAETEAVMREESGDWFGAVRFHDVELIT